jgi:hypothetical protein
MGQFAGTSFGIGTPSIYQGYQNPWGFSPFQGQGFAQQSFPQVAQLLQIVPQQLQQIHRLQQQQLQYLHQLLQLVPAQLQQIQQSIQFVPQQIQQLQHQAQPFGAGIGGFGLVPSPYLGQSAGQVM